MKEKNNQTAIDWLVEKHINQCGVLLLKDIESAQKMEIKQAQEYAEFCVHCDRNNLPLLDFEGFINLKSEE
jgi:2-hydroxy-3-keto-5-methylthiopentenyl-1-phosphate phosphatase